MLTDEMNKIFLKSGDYKVGRTKTLDCSKFFSPPVPAKPDECLAVNMSAQEYLRAHGYPFEVVMTSVYKFDSHEHQFRNWVFLDKRRRLRALRNDRDRLGVLVMPSGERIPFDSFVREIDAYGLLAEVGISPEEIYRRLNAKGFFRATETEPDFWTPVRFPEREQIISSEFGDEPNTLVEVVRLEKVRETGEFWQFSAPEYYEIETFTRVVRVKMLFPENTPAGKVLHYADDQGNIYTRYEDPTMPSWVLGI